MRYPYNDISNIYFPTFSNFESTHKIYFDFSGKESRAPGATRRGGPGWNKLLCFFHVNIFILRLYFNKSPQTLKLFRTYFLLFCTFWDQLLLLFFLIIIRFEWWKNEYPINLLYSREFFPLSLGCLSIAYQLKFLPIRLSPKRKFLLIYLILDYYYLFDTLHNLYNYFL